MDDKQVQFLPFHAINEFMIPEYRLDVIRTVLAGLDKIPSGRRGTINSMIKRSVNVPGFRNSSLAPLNMKVKNSVSFFERSSEFTAQILQGWSEVKADLGQQIYDMLKERGWETLPPLTDRTKLPGFLTEWPAEDTYEVLNQTYNEKYPGNQIPENDVRLMTVWISGRLPYSVTEEEEEA
jgi:hypothetical protein